MGTTKRSISLGRIKAIFDMVAMPETPYWRSETPGNVAKTGLKQPRRFVLYATLTSRRRRRTDCKDSRQGMNRTRDHLGHGAEVKREANESSKSASETHIAEPTLNKKLAGCISRSLLNTDQGARRPYRHKKSILDLGEIF
jgi:hypothetical protein